jgi:hypothetical protein
VYTVLECGINMPLCINVPSRSALTIDNSLLFFFCASDAMQPMDSQNTRSTRLAHPYLGWWVITWIVFGIEMVVNIGTCDFYEQKSASWIAWDGNFCDKL